MKLHSVRITLDAQEDMQRIYDGVLQLTQSPRIAMRQYDMIAEKIGELVLFPERTAKIVLDEGGEFALHRVIVGKYTVFYYVTDCEVIVTNVLYSSSDLVAKLI